MNSQEYIEVSIKITPFSDENAEIATAEISELPFESFTAASGKPTISYEGTPREISASTVTHTPSKPERA